MSTEPLSGFRLSPQQERLWHLQPEGSAYGAFCMVEIEGALDRTALKAAVQGSILRHDSLRSQFCRLPGMKTPIMVIAQTCAPQWEDLDWTGVAPQIQESRMTEWLQAAPIGAEDLSQFPLLRVKLLQLATERHLLLFHLPALCLDTQSLRLLVREISERYEDSAPLNSTEAAVQYVQFAQWQHQLLTEAESQAGRAYWSAISQDRIADLRLPFEHPVTQDATFRIEAQRIEISTANIRVFARQQQTSVRDVLLACWMVLVGRLTEAQTLTMGYGCDRRSYPELQALLGVVATWVPLHCPITLNLQFAELLPVLSEQRRAVEEWQDYFDWNGDSLNPSLVPSFFSIGFEFESGSTHWTHKNLAWRLRQYHACIERFKLKLVCTEQPDTLDLAFYADARQFAPEEIGSLAQQFQALLTDAIAHPHQPIGTLNLLSAREREALFAPCDLPPESDCVHRLFEAQAQQHPDAVALVYEDQRLTYAQLNRQANQLAHYLQTLGVGIESIVGIYMGRSPQSIVALLAVLKAGGAYLPLDPVLPTAAIATRLQQAQASWVIAEQALSETLPPLDSALGRIFLDREADAIAQAPESNPPSAVAPENLMYVLFTSGTTGQPKGIAIEHRQLYHYLRGILEPLDLPAGTSFATVSTLAADLGNTAIFPALCTGRCLHLISQDRLSDPVTLGAYIQQHRIDCLKIVPSHLQALLNTANPAQLLPQRCLVLGGEALSWELVAQLQALQPHCRILNHYGPTETTVGVLTYAIPSQPGAATLGETVPLGFPLTHTRVYVLDRQQQPVPKGLPGELYIGGAQLARGYHHQPTLTAERFVPHPFHPGEGQRLYKTGDRVRFLADGSLLFLGRLDRQAKVRGYRVELTEIEAVLQQNSDVRQAVVTASDHPSGLVAYIVPHRSQPLNQRELKQSLRQYLPEYMVPATFVFLKTLPLTANGKVNFQALPLPTEQQPDQTLVYTPPSTETEQAIAQIWQVALGLKRVGLHDNFFDLGGHSLLMVQVHSQLRERFNPNLAMGDLFRYPTVSTLAHYLNPLSPQALPDDPSLHRSLARAQTRKAIAQKRQHTQEVKDAAQ